MMDDETRIGGLTVSVIGVFSFCVVIQLVQQKVIMMCHFLSLCMFAALNVPKVVRSSSSVDDDRGDRWCG
jgi:hypothetical protein